MTPSNASEPDDIESLKRLLVAERAARLEAEAKATLAIAQVSGAEALIAHLKLAIEKMRRELYGSRSERGHKLLDQMEFELEDLEATAAQDEATAEMAAIRAGLSIPAHQRRRSGRRPFPDHLPRERIIVPGPSACLCCGSSRLAKLGEDITETLEVVPRQWKVIQHVREKFTCRACEKISQAPAPFHVIARGHAGPSLLAMILHAKFALHQPLNRQSETYAREGIDLPLSTLADHVGACAAVLAPLADLIRAHVLAAERIHGDDTPVALLAKGKTVQARLWTYVRDDRPFGGPDPPAAFYAFSRDRKGEHPERHLAGYDGILQADAYAGFNGLYKAERKPGPIAEAACWSHARRKFFVLADITSRARSRKPVIVAPLALEAVRRFDAIFAAERALNSLRSDLRLEGRRQDVMPLVIGLECWMRAERPKLSRHSDVAKAMDYMLTRWPAFVRFLDDGRICLSNNAAERALRGIALGRKAWLFAGSERGGDRAAIIYTLLQTAKLNAVDPHAWLADVLARIADYKMADLADLLPWRWSRDTTCCKLAA
ncbi:IS66 family transposase [Beijerinckia sp. L45]|uniref:IS66 family transposase n=1 Tax=Beijerinckia sp. L45 TaxID=1641855 RepID=UPI00131E87F4|nr:IS66 family transposase [Beijerinckia sp. L45]